MSQIKLDFNTLGLEKIAIGQGISTICDAKEYKYYKKKDKYDIRSNTQNLYFLPSKYLDSTRDSLDIIDLFLLTDEKKDILFISIFIQTEATRFIKEITEKIGETRFMTSSSISRVELRKRYFWLTNASIMFVLTIYNNEKAIQPNDNINLMIYKKIEKDDIGEWYILPNY